MQEEKIRLKLLTDPSYIEEGQRWITRRGDPATILYKIKDRIIVYHHYTGTNESHLLDGRLYSRKEHELDLMRLE